MTRPMSMGSMRARSMAWRAAATANREVYSPSAARCLSLMPVRDVIHSSEVSTNFSRSAFVMMPSGYARPVLSISALTSPIGLPYFLSRAGHVPQTTPSLTVALPSRTHFGDGAQRRQLARVRVGDAALDARERPVLGELFDVADGVSYGARVRAAVADDHDAAHAQKRRAAELGVVEPLLQVLERGARQHRARLRDDRRRKLALDHRDDGLLQPFRELQDDVTRKAVGDDHVNLAREHIAPLDVADEVQALEFAQQREGFLRQVVALPLLLADAHHSDRGPRCPQNRARVRVAHDSKLRHVVRLALAVRANVQENRRAARLRRHQGRERRAVNAGQHPDDHHRRRHRRARIARGDEAVGLALGDEARADPHRAAALAADSVGDRLVHADDLGGLDQLDALVAVLAPTAAAQLRLDDFPLADEDDADAEVARRGQRPVNLRVRRAVAAHRVHDDFAGQLSVSHRRLAATPHHAVGSPKIEPERTRAPAPRGRDSSFLLDLHDLAPLVVPALRADAVRHTRLLAVLAERGLRRAQGVVRTALARARLRVTTFRIRHDYSL